MEEAGEVSMTVEDAADAALVRKEVNHSQLVDRNKLLASGAMLMSSESEWQDPVSALRRTEGIPDGVDSKIEVACANSKAVLESDENLNDDNAMVEELTLKNYKSPNLLAAQHVNSREEMPFGAGWHHYVQLAGGSSANVIRSNDMLKESLYLGGEEAVRASGLPMSHSSIPSKQLDGHGEMSKNLSTRGNYVAVGGASSQSSGGIRTKAFSMSGFHRFFAKKSSKGKGTLHASQKAREGSGVMVTQDHKKMSHAGLASNASHGSGSGTKDLSVCNDANANIASLSGGGGDGSAASVETSHEGLCLRECLMEGCQKVNKVERLLIFREILELVTQAHLRGTALQKLRPSYFLILPSKNVRYIGSWSKPVKMNILDGVANQGSHYQEHGLKRRRFVDHASRVEESTLSKHQKLGGYGINVSMQLPFTARHGIEGEADINDIHSSKEQSSGCGYREELSFNTGSYTPNLPSSPSMSSPASMTMNFESVQLEERWYASPEELSGRTCTLQSNIYSLGVLFFELFCYFESWEVHTGAMFDLRHRILPPNFLSESAKEAGFCLWLLHPEPSSRPKASEILESEMINEVHHVPSVDDLSLAVDDDDAESELLLHFLLPLKEKKQKQALKLVDDLGCLREDIEKVERRNPSKTEHLSQTHHGMDSTPKEYLQKESVCSSVSQILQMNEARLMRNIRQLEHAYFSMRSQIALPDTDVRDRVDKDVLKKDSRLPQHQNDNEGGSGKTSTDRVGAFFEGIYKYARYSRFETRGILRNGDFLTSGNVICSLSFDRDEDYFAAAGVSKKIKIFEFSSLLNDMVDIHYPVIEMASKAKLSCVCWNNYIKNYLASTDYDGVVQLWDASTGQGFTQYAEHQKRAWSVDFSRVDPTKLASGSDDCSVKLWSINEKKCLSTIRSVANVCCVQFSSHSTHMLAFGSSDYKIYCYDLRNPRIPWCTLVGHKKAVSYVKFLDSETLVSASTDNTIKIWDLNNTTSGGLSTNACSLSVSGHTNEKNFVGLSVSDGYIACGSETNEVFAYYRSLPMPITSYKFGSIDPISGQETGDDNGLFVSSVCWRGKSNTVVAANSNGCIKLLQLV